MIPQKTKQYGILLNSMNTAIEKECYLEAITIEYAIMENRTAKLLVHLQLKSFSVATNGSLSLYNKTDLLRRALDNNDDSAQIFISGLTEKRNVEFLKRVRARLKKFLSSTRPYSVDNFRKERNGLTHALAFLNDDLQYHTPNDFKDLAIDGKIIANTLCKDVSYLKRYLKRHHI